MPAESEVEMSSPQGKAKTNIVMNNIKVNEDVKFEWVKTKKQVVYFALVAAPFKARVWIYVELVFKIQEGL